MGDFTGAAGHGLPFRQPGGPDGGLDAADPVLGLSGLMGVSLASIFLVYTGESIARVFFITAAAFAGLSLFGYTTKRDLSGMATFLFMGLIGIVIASLVNLFLGSTMVQFMISVAGVLVFSGLTAYDTQRITDVCRRRGWRGDYQKVDHGRAVPVSRLHQPVLDAAEPVRQPRIASTHADGARREFRRAFLSTRLAGQPVMAFPRPVVS